MESERPTGTILVVDDEENVRGVLARWSAEMGYAVQAAPDADTALQLMYTHPIDVALCDMKMPGHDGFWLLDQVRRFFPSTAVVLVTGLVEIDPMVTLRPGVVGYLVKPFTREKIREMILQGMAERKRLRAQQPQGPQGPQALPAGTLEGIVLSRD